MLDESDSCEADSEQTPSRKCVSQFFGRNKGCTRKIADDAWLKMCRKHYQRIKYKASKDNMFPLTQYRWLVFALNKMSGYFTNAVWDIQWVAGIRKMKDGNYSNIPKEHQLLYNLVIELDPMTGKNKTTDDVRRFIEAMRTQFDRRRANGDIYNELPKIEFLLQDCRRRR